MRLALSTLAFAAGVAAQLPFISPTTCNGESGVAVTVPVIQGRW